MAKRKKVVRRRSEPRPRAFLVGRNFIRRRDGKILAIRRAADDSRDPDKWEVAGGKIDKGEEFFLGVKREVLQETQLLVSPIVPFTYPVSKLLGDEDRHKGLAYLALFRVTKVIGGKIRLSKEHSAYKWVTYKQLLRLELTDEVREAAIAMKEYLI